MSGVIPIHLHSSQGLIADQNVGGSVRLFDLSRLVNSGHIRFNHVGAYLKAISASIPHSWPTLIANGEGETRFAVGVEKDGTFIADELEIAQGRYTTATLLTAIETEINELIDDLDSDEVYDVTLSEDATGRVQVDRGGLVELAAEADEIYFGETFVLKIWAFRIKRFDAFEILGEYDFSGMIMTVAELLDIFNNGTGGFDSLNTILTSYVPTAPTGASISSVSVSDVGGQLKIDATTTANSGDIAFGFCPTSEVNMDELNWATGVANDGSYYFTLPVNSPYAYSSYENTGTTVDTYPSHVSTAYGALNSYGDPLNYPLGPGASKPNGYFANIEYSEGDLSVLGLESDGWNVFTGTTKTGSFASTGDFNHLTGAIAFTFDGLFPSTYTLGGGEVELDYSDMRILFFSYRPFKYDGFLSRDSILAKKLGLYEQELSIMEEEDLSHTFPFKIQRLDPSLLYIRVDIPGTDHIWSGDNGVVGVMPIRLPFGSVERFTNPNAFNVGVFLSDIETIKVSILNENFTPVDLSYADWSLSFLLEEQERQGTNRDETPFQNRMK